MQQRPRKIVAYSSQGGEALARFADDLNPGDSVLDIGYGSGHHMALLEEFGLDVDGIDYHTEGDYTKIQMGKQYDGIWCSHVLEHIHDTGAFLGKIAGELKEGGLLAVTVPPLKHDIVGGHVSLWNEGLLLYRLILAGLDCSDARVGVYGYNISVLVRKKTAILPDLKHDIGDIDALSHLFPFEAKQNFNGRTGNISW